jgi:hypothetical protein
MANPELEQKLTEIGTKLDSFIQWPAMIFALIMGCIAVGLLVYYGRKPKEHWDKQREEYYDNLTKKPIVKPIKTAPIPPTDAPPPSPNTKVGPIKGVFALEDVDKHFDLRQLAYELLSSKKTRGLLPEGLDKDIQREMIEQYIEALRYKIYRYSLESIQQHGRIIGKFDIAKRAKSEI